MPYPNAQSLEYLEDTEVHVEAARQGCLWLGFHEDEINFYEDERDVPEFADVWEELDERAEEDPSMKTLVFFYFKGHGNVRNNQISAVGEFDEGQELEGFLRDLAIKENVHVIGLFDCCRRERGRGGMYT